MAGTYPAWLATGESGLGGHGSVTALKRHRVPGRPPDHNDSVTDGHARRTDRSRPPSRALTPLQFGWLNHPGAL